MEKNDLVTRLYLYFLYFQSVQSGKTKILPPHQTGLVTNNLHLLSRPVWKDPNTTTPDQSGEKVKDNSNQTGLV